MFWRRFISRKYFGVKDHEITSNSSICASLSDRFQIYKPASCRTKNRSQWEKFFIKQKYCHPNIALRHVIRGTTWRRLSMNSLNFCFIYNFLWTSLCIEFFQELSNSSLMRNRSPSLFQRILSLFRGLRMILLPLRSAWGIFCDSTQRVLCWK